MSSKKESKSNTKIFTGSNRISGKKASDALKSGNNAGMLYKKEIKEASVSHAQTNNTREYVRQSTMAMHKLRIAEKQPNGDCLRGYFGE
jgi:hypothetical protein